MNAKTDQTDPGASAGAGNAQAPGRPDCAVVIVAAGRGTRVGGDTPKQFRDLDGMRVLDRTIAAFLAHPRLGRVVVVLPAGAAAMPEATGLIAPEHLGQVSPVAGGDSRAASVRAGLKALADAPPDWVLIHDGARPLVTASVIDHVLDALRDHAAAAPGLPMTDTLWRVEGARQITAIADRAGLFRAQTPQGFHYRGILAAHARTGAEGATDDIALALEAGLDAVVVPGDEDNLKITQEADFARARRILAARGGGRTGPAAERDAAQGDAQASMIDFRSGNGFDVHAFGPGSAVTICGVTIPHDRGLRGHSDADVGMHALTDAIYGALAEGDIGRHFPPSEARWKGADSAVFLAHARDRIAARGFRLANADVTIICEEPKIGPHADAMRARLAEILKAEAGRISVKATTSEKLGFTGRREGIAALATVALVAAPGRSTHAGQGEAAATREPGGASAERAARGGKAQR